MLPAPTNLNRRDFILGMAAAAAVCSVPGWLGAQEAGGGRLLSAFSPPDRTEDYLALFSLDRSRLDMIRCPKMDAHGMAQNPRDPSLVAVFGQRTAVAALIDTKAKKTLQSFPSSKGRYFYGHGSFNPEASVLYATEFDLGETTGAIVIRDAKTLKIIGEFPTHGVLPHELHLTADGKTMVVANQGDSSVHPSAGRGPSVSYVDVASGKLLHKIVCSLDSVNFGHLALAKNGQVAVGADRRTFLSETNGKKKYHYHPTPILFGAPGKTTGERFPTEAAVKAKCLNSLSLCINEQTNHVGATYTEGGVVNFWNLENESLVHSWNVEGRKPMGVAVIHGGRGYAVNTTDGDLFLLDAKTFKVQKTFHYKDGDSTGRYFCGPHLLHLA